MPALDALPNDPNASATAGPLVRLARVFDTATAGASLLRIGGRITEATTSHIRVQGLRARARLGAIVEIEADGACWIGEVISIERNSSLVKLFATNPRLGLGQTAWVRADLTIRPHDAWRGRVIDALGRPIDGAGPLPEGPADYTLDRDPIPPLALDRIGIPIRTGVRAIDLFTPICAGQRIGIFAGPGVGKTTLVAMLCRAGGFDTIVSALVAERGREVREFLEDVIAPSAGRAVTVVASSSETAMMRKLAAKTAMSVAECFRDRGHRVLLVVDSLTRFAHALREVALSAGEPPVARGYAPSVFADLPRLLERAGPGRPGQGSITGVFSVLVDGSDHDEPVADTVRGILDGHIVLDRAIAEQGRYPAINPLTSLSRLAHLAWSREEGELVRRLRSIIASYEETRDLRAIGAYKPGGDAELDQAVALAPLIYKLIHQLPTDPAAGAAFDDLAALLRQFRDGQLKPGDARAGLPPN